MKIKQATYIYLIFSFNGRYFGLSPGALDEGMLVIHPQPRKISPYLGSQADGYLLVQQVTPSNDKMARTLRPQGGSYPPPDPRGFLETLTSLDMFSMEFGYATILTRFEFGPSADSCLISG